MRNIEFPECGDIICFDDQLWVILDTEPTVMNGDLHAMVLSVCLADDGSAHLDERSEGVFELDDVRVVGAIRVDLQSGVAESIRAAAQGDIGLS